MAMIIPRHTLAAFLLLLAGPGCATTEVAHSPSYADAPYSLGEVAVARGGRVDPMDAVAAVAAMENDATGAATPQRMIRNAFMEVEVRSTAGLDTAKARAQQITEALGGYVSEDAPRTLTLRLPADWLDEALDQFGALGQVLRRDVRANDVTAQHADLRIRLDNARALQTRLRELLEQAGSVQDVLAVETELNRVTIEVDRLEGQLRYLDNQVSFSTVRLEIKEATRPGPVGWVLVGAYRTVRWLFVW